MRYLVNDDRLYRPQDSNFSVTKTYDDLCIAQFHAEVAAMAEYIAVAALFGLDEGNSYATEFDYLINQELRVPVPQWRWYCDDESEALDESRAVEVMKAHGFVTDNIDVCVKKSRRRFRREYVYLITFEPRFLSLEEEK